MKHNTNRGGCRYSSLRGRIVRILTCAGITWIVAVCSLFAVANTGNINSMEMAGATVGQYAMDIPNPEKYLLSTPQIRNVLYPLQHASTGSSVPRVLASVATVADPLETRLGRAFDVQVSSLIRAFHTQGFVLDSIALTCKPGVAGSAGTGIRIPDAGTGGFQEHQRARSSVLFSARIFGAIRTTANWVKAPSITGSYSWSVNHPPSACTLQLSGRRYNVQ